jgi:hypothetical protein
VLSRRFPALTFGTGLLAVLVVFFPVLFYGRVISPVDTLLTDEPWRSTRNPAQVTNPDLEPAAAEVLPLYITAQRDGLASAIWSPYTAAGGPGTASWRNGLLSPFVLPFLPWLEPALLFNGMVLAKLVAAFAGTALLLRRLGAGEAASALGGTAFALSGSLSAHWLWPPSATMAVLPLLLWAADRTATGPPRLLLTRMVVCSLVWLALLSGGAREETIVAVTVSILWAVVRARARPGRVLAAVAGLPLALAVLAPALALSMGTATASHPAVARTLGPSALRLLIDPFAWGDPRQDTFIPPAALAGLGFRDVCLSIGIVTAALCTVGLVSRGRLRWWWTSLLAAALTVITVGPAATVLATTPGLDGFRASHAAPVVALAAACLAAAAADRLSNLARPSTAAALTAALTAAIALEQGMLAGHLLAYLPRSEARLEGSSGLELVRRSCEEPVRVAPLLDCLRPDTASAFGIEDLRSRREVADAYRRWLQAIDPQVWGFFGSRLRFNTVTTELGHPYLIALGARYVLEPPRPRLVEFVLGDWTLETEPRTGLVGPLTRDRPIAQELVLPEGCSRLGVHGGAGDDGAVSGFVDAHLVDEVADRIVGRWLVDANLLASQQLAWLDLQRAPRPGRRHRLVLRGRLDHGSLWLASTPDAHHLSGRLLHGDTVVGADLGLSFDTSGLATIYEGPDLRIWEHRRAASRFWLVHELITGTLDELLAADPPLDLSRIAVVDGDAASLVPRSAVADDQESIVLRSFSPASFTLDVHAARPGLMVSSIPARPPHWRARVDGAAARIVRANGLFIALPLTAGHHRVELEAHLPILWYGLTAAGCATLVALAAAATVLRLREERAT